MAQLTDAELLDALDTLAQAYVDVLAEIGDGTVTNKSSKAAENWLTTVLAFTDAQKVLDLTQGAKSDADQTKGIAVAPRVLNQNIVALDKHLGGIETALVARGLRGAPAFKDLYEAVTGRTLRNTVTFSPVVDPLATFDVLSATTGTYTDGSAIDSTKYAAAHLQLYVVLGGPTASTATYTVTCVKEDNTSESKAVVVPTGTVNGTAFDVGATTDRYKNVTNITVTGGTAGDQVKVRSVLERDTSTKDN